MNARYKQQIHTRTGMQSYKDNAFHLHASLASLGDPGGAFRVDSSERWPGSGVEARAGIGV